MARARGITVKELVTLLSNLPDEDQTLEVEVEGCDCYGPCGGIEITTDDDGKRLLSLTRQYP